MGTAQKTRTRRRYTFSKAPKRVYLEFTRACPLNCAACPVRVGDSRHPRELNTDEIKDVLRQIRSFSTPSPELIISGGDPLCRDDLDQILAYAVALNIKTTLWIGPTPHVTKKRLQKIKSLGVRDIGVSLDDATPDKHDALHVPGSFVDTVRILHMIESLNMNLHVNSLVTDASLVHLPTLYEAVNEYNTHQWNVFFFVPTNASKQLLPINPLQAEVLLNWLYDTSRTARFHIEIFEAPHYQRIVFERLLANNVPLHEIHNTPQAAHFGLRAGNGILFVSHVGDVMPSPFLPIVAGNVRGRSLVSLYRRSPLFRDLRDPTKFTGKCRQCKFRRICGGSRARAYAEHDDWTGDDPLCLHRPEGAPPAY